MQTINIDSDQMFFELHDWKEDQELLKTLKSCLDAQKQVGLEKFDSLFKPNDKAQHAVSKEALDDILTEGEDISDIRTHTDLSNCIVFHTTNLDGSVIDEGLIQLRQEADQAVMRKIRQVFSVDDQKHIECSGHFWYPVGGYMGWHTNLRKPGWRMYINYAEEEQKSYFRYRDPDSGEIVTCPDEEWNFRVFKITSQKPLWHCVYSDTNRFSLGYKMDLA